MVAERPVSKPVTGMVKSKVLQGDIGGYIPLEDGKHLEVYPFGGMFDRPLPCCGCGIGWFSFLLGIIFPLAWFFGTVLYLTNYYRSDPRERAGLAACAVAALICTVIVLIVLLVVLLKP